MSWNTTLSKLRDVLATLYPTVPDARRLVEDAGLNPSFITFDNKAINNWHNILQEAARHNKVEAIVQAAHNEYGENPELLRTWQVYLNAASATPGNKYNIKLENAQGTVIGDNAQVTQHFGGTYINTRGGSYVAGNVNTGGGDFVGRDKHERTAQDTLTNGLQELLAKHQRNLLRLQQQKAIYTAGEEPLSLVNQIEQEEQEILRTKVQLGLNG